MNKPPYQMNNNICSMNKLPYKMNKLPYGMYHILTKMNLKGNFLTFFKELLNI